MRSQGALYVIIQANLSDAQIVYDLEYELRTIHRQMAFGHDGYILASPKASQVSSYMRYGGENTEP